MFQQEHELVAGASKLFLIKNERPDSVLNFGRRWASMPCDKGSIIFWKIFLFKQDHELIVAASKLFLIKT